MDVPGFFRGREVRFVPLISQHQRRKEGRSTAGSIAGTEPRKTSPIVWFLFYLLFVHLFWASSSLFPFTLFDGTASTKMRFQWPVDTNGEPHFNSLIFNNWLNGHIGANCGRTCRLADKRSREFVLCL
jgi:hypothetical protein